MNLDIAAEWADRLETLPQAQRGRHSLRSQRPGESIRHCAIGVLGDICVERDRTLAWIEHPTRSNPSTTNWIIAPLVADPSPWQIEQLPPRVIKMCGIRTQRPGFNNGSLPISTLNDEGLAFERIATLIRRYADQI